MDDLTPTPVIGVRLPHLAKFIKLADEALIVGKVIGYTKPSDHYEPRRVGGGERGSEPVRFRTIYHEVDDSARFAAECLWKLMWIKRTNFYNTMHYASFIKCNENRPRSWKRKNMVGYYKNYYRQTSVTGENNIVMYFWGWDIVDAQYDIVVGTKI